MENEKLITIFKGQTFEAEIVRSKLESCGIPAMIYDNSMSALLSSYSLFAGSVSVLINPSDRERAQMIIDENESC